MRTRTWLTTIALAGLAATAARADSSCATASGLPSLALTVSQVGAELRGIVPVSNDRTPYSSIHYRPRWRRDNPNDAYYGRGASRLNGYAQLQGGVFDPSGDVSNGAMFGMRIGTNTDDRVQVGLQLDVSHRSDQQTAVVGSGTLPGGGAVERRRELSSASSDLVPVMAFVQVSPTGSGSGPYVGLAGGYQALFLSARDFTTGAAFDATYGGWGWQFYGGFAFPMSSATRLTLEGFTNSATLGRDVDDPATGVTYREIVDGGGVGLRGGVSWSF